jgi:ketosteroid isomerase-like protein
VSRADLEDLARRLVGAFNDGDKATQAELLAPDVVAYITNKDAGVDEVRGRDAYLARMPDLRAAGAELTVTQALAIEDDRVMFAVEIRAHRAGDDLHNFAAFLARVSDGQIAELWMVEAQPAHSDEFWSR